MESIEGIVGSHQIETDTQFYIHHLIRKLGCEPYSGQRAIPSFSKNFHDDMIQLIEFLISGYLLTWLRVEGLDNAGSEVNTFLAFCNLRTLLVYFSLLDLRSRFRSMHQKP
ncbi:hypothetical protein NC653_039978 [Populus alba x Populus x berolinensis]|uniref:Uncharacterized protein n=1 Tax=Populus alba x Populus x berolinensis TaxID=444605 RepID=A0AAD6LE26_9ROSI|nr:hypothetical protein NC653_039978 [Populus alba x Populus x berolinensis]